MSRKINIINFVIDSRSYTTEKAKDSIRRIPKYETIFKSKYKDIYHDRWTIKSFFNHFVIEYYILNNLYSYGGYLLIYKYIIKNNISLR
jgi:hypothetical protein